MELADIEDLKSSALGERMGSNPILANERR